MEKGLIHIYYGDGAGKTTAAAGLAVRAIGSGMKALFAQFLKNGRSGELASLEKLGVEVLQGEPCEKFYPFMSDAEKAETAKDQREAFQSMMVKTQSGQYGLLVLDEVLDAVKLGMIGPEELLCFLRGRPEGLEVALTGHEVFPKLVAYADYVTEVKKIKHPYDKGVKARRGVEW